MGRNKAEKEKRAYKKPKAPTIKGRKARVRRRLIEYDPQKTRVSREYSYLSQMTPQQKYRFRKKYGYTKRYLNYNTIYRKTDDHAREYLYNSALQKERRKNAKRKRKISDLQVHVRAQLSIENKRFFDPSKRLVTLPWDWQEYNKSAGLIIRELYRYARRDWEIAVRFDIKIWDKKKTRLPRGDKDYMHWGQFSVYGSRFPSHASMARILFEQTLDIALDNIVDYELGVRINEELSKFTRRGKEPVYSLETWYDYIEIFMRPSPKKDFIKPKKKAKK